MNVVETERLILCPFSTDDVEEYFQIVDDPDIRKYVSPVTRNSIDELNKLIERYSNDNSSNSFYFEIRKKNTNKIVGAIIAIRIKKYTLDIFYLIGSQYRGNGYMTEALFGFIGYLYNDISTFYHSFYFTIKNENIASQRVVQKCGGQLFRSLKNASIWIIKLNQLDLL